MNNERLLHLAEKYGTEFAKEVLKHEAGQHTEKSESETVADMINQGTKKVLADRKEKEEAQVRENLITWGGMRR